MEVRTECNLQVSDAACCWPVSGTCRAPRLPQSLWATSAPWSAPCCLVPLSPLRNSRGMREASRKASRLPPFLSKCQKQTSPEPRKRGYRSPNITTCAETGRHHLTSLPWAGGTPVHILRDRVLDPLGPQRGCVVVICQGCWDSQAGPPLKPPPAGSLPSGPEGPPTPDSQ